MLIILQDKYFNCNLSYCNSYLKENLVLRIYVYCDLQCKKKLYCNKKNTKV